MFNLFMFTWYSRKLLLPFYRLRYSWQHNTIGWWWWWFSDKPETIYQSKNQNAISFMFNLLLPLLKYINLPSSIPILAIICSPSMSRPVKTSNLLSNGKMHESDTVTVMMKCFHSFGDDWCCSTPANHTKNPFRQ